MFSTDQVKEHWDTKADEFGQNQKATHGDIHLRELEIKAIEDRLGENLEIIDVGCGNGYSTLRFSQKFNKSNFIGVDYSEKMIRVANESLKNQDYENIQFMVMDILEPHEKFKKRFDIAVTERCIINLIRHEDQVQAIINLGKMLKAGGKLILSEESIQSYSKINDLRKNAGLPDMAIQWHNLYMDIDRIQKDLPENLILENVYDFSSSYYLGTRFFKALIYHEQGRDPGADVTGTFNQLAAEVPSLGDYGLIKIYEFRKR